MKFEIGKEIKGQEPGYYIEVEFMHGDADGDSVETFGPFFPVHFELAYEFIGFLESVFNGSRYNFKAMRREDTSGYAKHWERFVDGGWPNDLPEPDWNAKDTHMFRLEWPGDHTCDYQYRASMEGYTVYYIDLERRKFEVKVCQ